MKKTKPEPKKEREPIETIYKIVGEEIKNGRIKVETKIRDIKSDVKTVKPDDNLRVIMEMFSDYKIPGAAVVDKDKIVGVISRTDLMKVMKTRGIVDPEKNEIVPSVIEKLKVEDAMTRKPLIIGEDKTIADANDMMVKNDIDRLLVVNKQNKLIGVVSREDIIKAMTAEFFVKSGQVSGDVSVKTDIDKFLEVLEKKKVVGLKDVSEQIGVEVKQVEEWAKILEENGMIELEFPFFGRPRIRWIGVD